LPLLESTKAQELLTYWRDCQLVGFGENVDEETMDQFYDQVVTSRIAEAKTPFGVMIYQRLLHSRKAA